MNVRQQISKEIQLSIEALIINSKFSLTKEEYGNLVSYDFNLGNFLKEGVTFIDILKTEKLRITLLILLPQQTLPEHLHPSYLNEKGKEETIRVIYGKTKIYIEGNQNISNINLPPGNESFYTAKREINLIKDQQFTISPGMVHWFQSGSEGSVSLEFQTTVEENRNIFTNPNIT